MRFIRWLGNLQSSKNNTFNNKERKIIMKKFMLIGAVLATFCGANVFAMANDCGECDKPCDKKEMRCPKKDNCKFKQPRDMKKQKDFKKFPQKPNFSPEQQAEMKAFFDTVKEYKANPTEENKAKVIALLNKGFDKRIEMSEKRVADMKAQIEKIEKRNAELKANRDAEIQKQFDKIISFEPKKHHKRDKE